MDDQKKFIDIDLNNSLLELMIKFVYSNNFNIKFKDLRLLNEFIKRIDLVKYRNVPHYSNKLIIIKSLLDFKLENKVYDQHILKQLLFETIPTEDVRTEWDIITEPESIDDNDVTIILNYISKRLMLFNLINKSQSFYELYDLGLKKDYNNFDEYIDKLINMISSLNLDVKDITIGNNKKSDYGADDASLSNMIYNVKKQLDNPSLKLKTGIQMLNSMLSDGFETGRVYVLLGKYKGGKSITMLDIALQVMENNDFDFTFYDNKKPCVLYISQENDDKETLERIVSHYFDLFFDMKRYSVESIKDELQKRGFNENKLAFKMRYRPNKSINTQDVENMIDELYEDGYRVVMIVHDYIKRIKSVEHTGEIRLDLAAVIDEFSVIAKTKKVSVLTAMQINREGVRKAEELRTSGQQGIILNLNGSFIGESQGIIENADNAFIILQEEDPDGRKTMSFLDIASRSKKVTSDGKKAINYFSHPYVEDKPGVYNEMKLIQDVNLPTPVSFFFNNSIVTTNEVRKTGPRKIDLSPKD